MTGFAPDAPAPDEITAPWWDATRENRLILQMCQHCAHVKHPPRALCTGCGSDEPDWTASEGRGVVDSFTVVHRAPRPGLAVPYVIARVRLAEGVLLLTRLQEREPDDWRIDDPVRVAWAGLADGRALPVVVPDAAPSREKGS
jgi:uncharacterized OB-fold protein